MSSRLRYVLAAMLVIALAVPSVSVALERTSVRATDVDSQDIWRGGATCSVSYFNLCTGWLYTWSGWSPGDILGVTFESCCGSGSPLSTVGIYMYTGSPTGYGFTGTLAAYDADASHCPTGAPLWSTPWLPATGASPGDLVVFNVGTPITGTNVAMTYTTGTGTGDPYSMASDHPAAGPTGPQSCGFCYPSARAVRTFYWGNATTPLCPGSTLDDGICDVEFMWIATFCDPTPIESTSWGQVKSLYR